ncbi:MAG: SDR family NAD(P)-dependent oxidoreductase, partial [Chitinophagaceae bacterium]
MAENNPFSLTGKVIVVTGATGILGEAFVHAIAAAGASVVMLGRNEEVGNDRMNQLKGMGHDAIFIKADVLIEGDLGKARDEVMQKWGRIDGLVNAAGGNVAEAVIPP